MWTPAMSLTVKTADAIELLGATVMVNAGRVASPTIRGPWRRCRPSRRGQFLVDTF